jgi:hypothetical protein
MEGKVWIAHSNIAYPICIFSCVLKTVKLDWIRLREVTHS